MWRPNCRQADTPLKILDSRNSRRGPSAGGTVASRDAIPVKISVKDETTSGLWLKPKGAKAVLVLAHGAGVGMTHKGMTATAEGLAARGIATLRFNFLYMERGAGRPDAPPLAHA